MDTSLVRLNPAAGERLGRWRLKDPCRACGIWPESSGRRCRCVRARQPLPGVALQAEHDDLTQCRSAPVLVVWDGDKLLTPTAVPVGGSYVGDIVKGPNSGFVLSCQRMSIAVQWVPAVPAALLAVAQLQEVCAFSPRQSARQPPGVLMGRPGTWGVGIRLSCQVFLR